MNFYGDHRGSWIPTDWILFSSESEKDEIIISGTSGQLHQTSSSNNSSEIKRSKLKNKSSSIVRRPTGNKVSDFEPVREEKPKGTYSIYLDPISLSKFSSNKSNCNLRLYCWSRRWADIWKRADLLWCQHFRWKWWMVQSNNVSSRTYRTQPNSGIHRPHQFWPKMCIELAQNYKKMSSVDLW